MGWAVRQLGKKSTCLLLIDDYKCPEMLLNPFPRHIEILIPSIILMCKRDIIPNITPLDTLLGFKFYSHNSLFCLTRCPLLEQ